MKTTPVYLLLCCTLGLRVKFAAKAGLLDLSGLYQNFWAINSGHFVLQQYFF